MSIYQSIKKAITEESEVEYTSLETVYEEIYRRKTRLEDMDDFTSDMLIAINDLIKQKVDPKTAFKSVIDKQYEFANSSYFQIPLDKYLDSLVNLLSQAVTTSNPNVYWKVGIGELVDSLRIMFKGKEYTLDEIYNELSKGGY